MTRTYVPAAGHLIPMTETVAHQIRYRRVELQWSWRAIAHLYTGDDNQFTGRDLCHAAAAVLGEDARTWPWTRVE